MYQFHLYSLGTFDADHPIGPAQWPYFDLFSLHSGRVTIEFAEAAPLTLTEGDVVLIYPHTPFKGVPLDKEALASVQHFSLDPSQVHRLPDCLADLPARQGGFELHTAPDPQILLDIKRAIRLAGNDAKKATQALRESLHTLILIALRNGFTRLSQGGSSAADTIRETANWALQQADRSLSAVDLARHAGLSPSRFRERFHRELGMTPRDFLKDLRMNEGKRLLRETRRPIKEIAERCGYGDLVAFSRAFQARFATTPARYRKESAPRG